MCLETPAAKAASLPARALLSERHADTLNQIRVSITPVEAESVEKGLDSCKWLET